MSSMETCTSSGVLSSNGSITTRRSKIIGLTLIQASAASTLILYDNNSTNSGTVLAQINNTVNSSTQTLVFNLPVEASKGIYAAVTGTGATFIVHYALM